MREAFEDNRDIFFIKDNSPQTLADKIVEIKDNPKLLKEVGDNALVSYDDKLSNAKAKEILENQIFSKIERLD
jgi:glycosyltransferase involved in cell wall biosynthesis